jgi:hypothetical protein
MEKNSANLTDEWYIDGQMTRALEEYDGLLPSEMDEVKKLWNDCLGPSRTKMQALSVMIDPRIWLLELKGLVNIDDKLIARAEMAFDELVNKVVDEDKRHIVNKTWMALKNARKARLQGVDGDGIFNNTLKIARSEIIGPWRWWSAYAGSTHSRFMHDIARVVLNLRCNASATERVNSMYKHVIGLERCRMNNDRAFKLVYTYVNSKMMKRVRDYQRELAIAEAKQQPIFELPKLVFESSKQDPQVFGSLAHDSLTSIGVDAFVADDHVHELHDIMEGLSVPGNVVEVPRDTSFEEEEEREEEEEEGSEDTDDDMAFSPEEEREMERILERQSKRARGERLDGDNENKTPPHPRVSRRPKETPIPDDDELPLHSLG